MDWTFTADRPVYQQIMEAVCGSVLKGELKPGQRVPSVRELAAAAKVNPNTMQRALTELEREGLLVGGGTSGRTVTTDEAILAAVRKDALEEVARQCAAKFKVFGVTPAQAAQLLLALDEEKEE